MTNKLASVVIGETIAKAMQDEDLKKSLLADPKKVLSDAGAADGGITYKAVEDSATGKNIVLPFQPLTDAMKVDSLPEGAGPAVIARFIITKAQSDAAFKEQVISDIDGVLQDLGINLPSEFSIQIHADTADLQNIVIPYAPPVTGELSDDQLAAVAGGKGSTSSHTNTVSNAEAVVNAVGATEAAAVADVAAAAEAAAVAVAVVVLT